MRGLQAVIGVTALALGVSACGGGERQDAKEPSGNFDVQVVSASFPSKQSIAGKSVLKITVKNADSKTIPNVAVTVETQPQSNSGAPQAFAQSVQDTRLADPSRPIWILDQGPKGGDTSYTNTWAGGPLKPGGTKSFEWHLTAVKPGSYTLHYVVAPGLNGRAKPSGNRNTGSFSVKIDDRPPAARVGDNGEVIREPGK